MLYEFGLGDQIHSPVKQLSGGEIQRVTVARCLLSPAPFILADEPTGQLDSQTSAQVFEALVGATQRGKAVIIVTHDEQLASKADFVFELCEGTLVDRSDSLKRLGTH